MAYALDFPNAPRDADASQVATAPRAETAAAETALAERPSLFARIIRRIEIVQMARVRRELRLYAPHLEARLEAGEHRTVKHADDTALPFVR